MSKTNMLIRSELRESNITKKLFQAKRFSNWESARAATDRYVTGSHAKNAVFCFECYREGVGALECYSASHFWEPLTSVMVQKNVSQTFLSPDPFWLQK